MSLIIPWFAEASTAIITIDGVTYRVPLIDSDGHLQVDVLTSALPSGAATSARQDTMITALQLIDDLRAALDSVQTDRLNVNAYADGASEIMTGYLRTATNSAVRATIATPASGKKIRLVSVGVYTLSATGTEFHVYFGTGSAITTNPSSAVALPLLDTDHNPAFFLSWPDGAGPVGAVDEVLSGRTGADITTNGWFLVHYREE